VQVESAKVWDDPAHEGDYWSLQTELITGERVRVIGQQGIWSQIVAVEQPTSKDLRGYPGWVRSASLATGWPTGDQWAIVMVKSTILRESQNAGAAKMMTLNLDTRLPVVNSAGDPVEVRLPDGRAGWVAAGDVRLAAGREDAYPLDTFYQTAEALTGVPYVWGGTTSASLDCAGFIYRLFHAYGITLARDANDQAMQTLLGGGQGTPVEAGAEQRGTLVFTADRPNGPVTHVLMMWGNGQIIDAEPQRGVSIHPLADHMRVAYWSGASSFLP
jgi:cell wall-associated NlpC family hydrolase